MQNYFILYLKGMVNKINQKLVLEKKKTALLTGLKENKMKTQSHLYDVIIKEQPEAVALDDGDVVPTVGTTAE